MKSIVRDLIDSHLPQFAREASISIPAGFLYDLEQPKNKEHGDVASNVAFRLAKAVRQNPLELAVRAGEFFLKSAKQDARFRDVLRDIRVAGPGFLNFFLSSDTITQALKKIWDQQEKFGASDFGRKEKVIIEFVSANPTGPLTIAHGRQAVIGDVLARILERTGHEVFREYYLNDRGVQIQTLGRSVYIRYLELAGIQRAFPEEGYQGDYIRGLARVVFDGDGKKYAEMPEPEALVFFSKYSADTILEDIRKDLARLGVTFDSYFSEQTLGERQMIGR